MPALPVPLDRYRALAAVDPIVEPDFQRYPSRPRPTGAAARVRSRAAQDPVTTLLSSSSVRWMRVGS